MIELLRLRSLNNHLNLLPLIVSVEVSLPSLNHCHGSSLSTSDPFSPRICWLSLLLYILSFPPPSPCLLILATWHQWPFLPTWRQETTHGASSAHRSSEARGAHCKEGHGGSDRDGPWTEALAHPHVSTHMGWNIGDTESVTILIVFCFLHFRNH